MQKFMTAFVGALFVTISLKGLHVFHFIKWNPIAFLQQVKKVDWSVLACWIVLFFILFMIAYVLMTLFYFLKLPAPFISASILGIIIAFAVEGQVRNLPIEWQSIKKVSIPFVVLVFIVLRFLTETAYSMRK